MIYYSLNQLNEFDAAEFIDALGGIYEHSPWVAEQVVPLRPFATLDALLVAMQKTVASSSQESKLALIRAHPELQGKPASAELTIDSKREQRSAGLDQCTPAEMEQLSTLNAAYRNKFGFPIIIAVRGLTRGDIIERMRYRIGNNNAVEFHACLAEIDKIARLRLTTLVQ